VVAFIVNDQIESLGKRVLVLAHTREIVGHTSNKLSGIPHGIIQAERTCDGCRTEGCRLPTG
jgi:hypothetical protein